MSMTSDFFAMVRRDELWVRGAVHESRLNQGQATTRGREIIGRNVIDDAALHASLREVCDSEMERVRPSIVPMREARVRAVVTATTEDFESTVAITIDGISVVTTTDRAVGDYQALKRLLRPPTAHPPTRPLPIVWRNGSAAVLLHEAIGHAAEHGHAPLQWPRWLRARDETRDGRVADLIAGEKPLARRRESFRDVPMLRMTNLVVEQKRAPFELPEERIEVHLVAGGAYEPLTELVTINICLADLIRGDRTQRLWPFALRASRSLISGSLLGATGDPIRYPGVICSREAQEIFVASHAPVMVMAEMA
ncbi:MAG TPA: hypothetical protein VKL19_06860 [Thermoanaerobaculia bacterium]|nr:hypothetical protein [Thermoanaerobaculia bacterium]